jgi:hypothetical protein
MCGEDGDMTKKRVLTLATLMWAGAAPAAGQGLANRHMLEVRMGAWHQVTDHRTDVGPGGITTSVGASGFLGGIAYGFGLRENLGLRITVGAMGASVDTEVAVSGVSSEVAVVTPLLIGLRYYLSGSAPTSPARPFLSGSVGAFVGSQQKTMTGTTVSVEARTEASMGFEAGAGVDVLIGRRFVLSALVAYDVMTDFDQPVGGSENYSGPQISLGFGFLFGGGST